MKNKVCILLLVIFCISIGYAQNDLESRVDKYVKWMTRKKNPNIWGAAAKLYGLGTNVSPVIKRKYNTLPTIAKIGCLKALISLGELDYTQQKLVEILEERNPRDLKIMATGMLEVIGDFELEEELLEVHDRAFDPYVKIAIAKLTWQISRSPDAIKSLKGFLKVDNFQLQAEAALALGEVGNINIALPILNRLKEQPTPQGRMAQILLNHEAQVSRYETLLSSQPSTPKETVTKDKLKYPLVDEVIRKINEYHVVGDKFTKKKLINSAVDGVVAGTDVHSAFWTKEEWDDFVRTTINEEYVGIGVYVGEQDGQFTITSPVYSGPAYKAGVRSLDKVLEVNGWSTRDKTIDEIVKKIKGEKGTSVKLKIYRNGWSKAREIEVNREKIRVPSLFTQMLPGNIGYIKLTQFGRKGTEDMEKALRQLEKDGMKAFVLDLRGNGGGFLQVAVDIVDKFISGKKLVVYSEGRHPQKGKRFNYYSTNKTHPDFPMVVLVDESSASASEIVAGALKHYKRAVLIGQRTFGKGSVQEPIALDTRPGARLKLTIALYYLPDGSCIHNIMDEDGKIVERKGISPNIEVSYKDFESWKNEEYTRLEEKKAFQSYLDKHYQQNIEKFHGLADNDQLDYSKYPEFEAWYTSLKTKASKNDVRYWLRAKVRARVSDDRGKQYACDYLEDPMLQRGIWELCKKINIDVKDLEEYRIFAEELKGK
ncbi:S41 family peptidase [Candidatus Uabimicrobium amorphum]|uniref:Peptidase S41 n=1 Tax=Uabimicrobium amorphum TaxID=2596890 RepID=A0A5S9IHD4_UABAM|nr:S41 family peptidase [Candidatus Uabimicrobium amorphum]BBM81839.1 peptidase S41 [Candidatus Uabimicrobium amorphum]